MTCSPPPLPQVPSMMVMGRAPGSSRWGGESSNVLACPLSTSLPNQLPLYRLSLETALLVASCRREATRRWTVIRGTHLRTGQKWMGEGGGAGSFYFISHFHWVSKTGSSRTGLINYCSQTSCRGPPWVPCVHPCQSWWGICAFLGHRREEIMCHLRAGEK